MLKFLLPELKQLIAMQDSEVWFRLWWHDPAFREWSESESGRKSFVNLFTIVRVDRYCSRFWTLFGNLHREGDLPAVICYNGTQQWYHDGKLHRDNDLPAIIGDDGSREWYKNGKLHRNNDLPAMIYPSGEQRWYQDGKRHRENNLPAVIYADGGKKWYQNGQIIH